MGNFDGDAEDVCHHHLQFACYNTCLGPSTRTAQTYSDASTKNAISHLRRVHKLGPDGELPPVAIRQQSLREAFGNTTPRVAFNPEVFKAILLRWMTICNIPFNAVENTSFRLLTGYLAACVRSCYSFLSYVYLLIVQTASYTAIPRHLPSSGNTIRSWILDTYQKSQIHIRNTINWTDCAVHISLDLWTSPNHRSFLAVVGHLLIGTEMKTLLLGFRRLIGSHSGENQAALFWEVAAEMGITRRLGYFTLDNASNNDTMLEAIADRLANLGIPFDPKKRRIRCLGHIINLVVKSFLFGENRASLEFPVGSGTPEEEIQQLREWRKQGPLGKLYNCIRHILKTPQRRDRFADRCRLYTSHHSPLSLIMANDTRWNGDLAAISRALELREAIQDYIVFELRNSNGRTADDLSLVEDELTADDWSDVRCIHEILQPFKKWTMTLQGKRMASLFEVIPAFDELLSHLEEQRQYHNSLPSPSPFIVTSLNNAWSKLDKFDILPHKISSYYANSPTGITHCWMIAQSTLQLSPFITRCDLNISKTNGTTSLTGLPRQNPKRLNCGKETTKVMVSIRELE